VVSGRCERHNVHSRAHILAFTPKISLNLLSLVLTKILVERVTTSNVAANVQNTVGSTGIGIGDEEVVQ
jgi:hypothetical protein